MAVIESTASTSTAGGAGLVNDKVVQVAFKAGISAEQSEWLFTNYLEEERALAANPGDVVMTGPGEIIFTRSPADADWRFAGAAVKNPGDQFKVRVPRSGALLIIRDDWLALGRFPYLVIIEDSRGEFHTSPDPEIINTNPA